MRGGRSARAGIAVRPAFTSSFSPGLNGSPHTGTLSSMACSNGTTLTTNSPVAMALLVVSLSALQVKAMYIGSWQTRVQVPNAAALTRPSLSTVVISARHELGAKTLSHHAGWTSTLAAGPAIVMDRSDAGGEFAHGSHQLLRRLIGDIVLGIGGCPFDLRVVAWHPRNQPGRGAVRAQTPPDQGRAPYPRGNLPERAAGPPRAGCPRPPGALRQVRAFTLRLAVLEVRVALEHVALLDLDQRGLRALAIVRDARRIGKLGEMRHGGVDRFEYQRRIAGGRAVAAAAFVAGESAVDDDQPRELVRKRGGERDRQAPRGGMTDHDPPLPSQGRHDGENGPHVGVDRVVLAGAPAGCAEAALVEAGNLAVGRQCFGDADPVVGVEIVGAMH